MNIYRKLINNVYKYYYSNDIEVSQNDYARINKLKIPPAWQNVLVSSDPQSTIQATGYDEKGRKQYRYHQIHIEKADREKFDRMINFIKHTDKINSVLNEHSLLPFYNLNKIISIVILIVQKYYIRVGKEVYARTNKSYGITSIRKKHVKIFNNKIVFNFKGKSNQRLNYTITEENLIHDIKILMKLEGDKLFQYIKPNENGVEKIYGITDVEINNYIHAYINSDFTIKDFRTAGANLCFINNILYETKKRKPKNKSIIKKNLINAITKTAKNLKHTKSVSKKSYILDFIIELYQNEPNYFTINTNPHTLLLDILKKYKQNILYN